MKLITKLFVKYQDYFWITLLVFLSSLHLLYAIRTSLYFSVDDFGVLSYIRNHSSANIFTNFLINGDLFGFRKILGYEVMKLLFDFFRVNPLPYILTNHFFQLTNLILLFFIIKFLTKNSFSAFFISMLFNKVYLFYFSNIHEYLACFFALLTILLFLKYPKRLYLSLTTFVLALMSKELAFSIPFILASLAFVKKINIKSVLPFFWVLVVYCIYQLSFVLKGAGLPKNNGSYQISLNPNQLLSAFIFYFPVASILLIAALIALQKKFDVLWLAVSIVLTILPALFLNNRHEAYYIYIPFAYFAILLSLLLPKITFKNFILYIAIIFVFGGRGVFPVVARQNYPNWQKVSMENVLSRVEAALTDNPKAKEIVLKDIYLERDARLMLRSGTLDLFLPENISSKYTFVFSEGDNLIKVISKT